jgi:hypothetical protein
MIKNICVILLLVTISACTKTTCVRSAPNYSASLAKAKLGLFLPPNTEVNQIDAFNKKTRAYNYEDQLEDIIVDVFINKMQDKGYNVKYLSRAEIAAKKLSKCIVESKDQFNDVLTKLYLGGAWPESKAYSIDYKIPTVIDIGQSNVADLIVLMNFYAESKTSAAITKDVAADVFIGVISVLATGRHISKSSEPTEFSRIRLAIIDSSNGQVLWTHSVGVSSEMIGTMIDSFSKGETVDRKKLSGLIDSALEDLPCAKDL